MGQPEGVDDVDAQGGEYQGNLTKSEAELVPYDTIRRVGVSKVTRDSRKEHFLGNRALLPRKQRIGT